MTVMIKQLGFQFCVCVGCLFLRTPSRAPYRTPSACANRAAYPDPPPRSPSPRIHRRPGGLPWTAQHCQGVSVLLISSLSLSFARLLALSLSRSLSLSVSVSHQFSSFHYNARHRYGDPPTAREFVRHLFLQPHPRSCTWPL